MQCGREVTHALADTRANCRARMVTPYPMRAGLHVCLHTGSTPGSFYTAGFNPGYVGTVAGQSVVKRCEQWHFGVLRTREADANRSYVHTNNVYFLFKFDREMSGSK